MGCLVSSGSSEWQQVFARVWCVKCSMQQLPAGITQLQSRKRSALGSRQDTICNTQHKQPWYCEVSPVTHTCQYHQALQQPEHRMLG
jgi:hypothetical protein